MGSRSGDLDPSVITYLMKKENLSPSEMSVILNNKSGIYGISRVSLDFRDVEMDMLSGGHHATLALDVFNYEVAQNIAKCAVAMGGVDVITFTAGIGENSPEVRRQICESLSFMGVKIDNEKNNCRGEEVEISTPDSTVRVFVVPTNEELMIARDTLNLIK